MAIITATLSRSDFEFTVTDAQQHNMLIDIPVEQGGQGNGFRPMQTLLAALCGCSGVDVVSILKKQKQSFSGLSIFADGERNPAAQPSLWKTVHLRFDYVGAVSPTKAYRATALSINKYCSVAETLRMAGATISFEVRVNGEAVNE
jgi:putative redox protein